MGKRRPRLFERLRSALEDLRAYERGEKSLRASVVRMPPRKRLSKKTRKDYADSMLLKVELPADLSGISPEELRLAFAASLFATGKVSAGKAAQTAGVSRLTFLQNGVRFGVPVFDMTEE